MKITIDKIINLNGWKSLKLPTTLGFISSTNCLCCGENLETLTHISDKKNMVHVDLGCCPKCGFVTYKDKPSHQWITDFYTSTWNQDESENNLANTVATTTKCTEILQKLNLPKNTLIGEIGTGRGGNFAALLHHGYTNLVGVENSDHRARAVQKAFPNTHIYTGSFEEENVQKSLSSHGKYGVLYTSHVFEHVYDPSEAIQLCSNLQGQNGYLIISVPNFVKESAICVTSFLPHLHSFTLQSLESLLIKHNYVIIDSSFTTDYELTVVAQKSTSTQAKINSNSSFEFAQKKIENDFALSEIPESKPVYYWFSKKDSSKRGVIILNDFALIRLFQVFYLKFRDRNKGYRSFVITKKDDGFSQLSIVHRNLLTLFYK